MMGRVAMGSDGAAIAVDPSIAMNTYFVPQGISADIIATEYGFSRDDADALAVESQNRAEGLGGGALFEIRRSGDGHQRPDDPGP
jgi:acetyl-CoA C-acetyltransferase